MAVANMGGGTFGHHDPALHIPPADGRNTRKLLRALHPHFVSDWVMARRLFSSSCGGSPLAEETRMQETLVTPSDIPFCWALLSMLKYANSLRCPMARGRAPNPVRCRRRNGEYHTLASLTHCSLAHVTARWDRRTGAHFMCSQLTSIATKLLAPLLAMRANGNTSFGGEATATLQGRGGALVPHNALRELSRAASCRAT